MIYVIFYTTACEATNLKIASSIGVPQFETAFTKDAIWIG